jgi:multiple sugar transport system permease protein
MARMNRKGRKRSTLAREEAKWGLIFISPWIVGFLAFYLIPMVASFAFSLYKINLGDQSAVAKVLLTQKSFKQLRTEGIPDTSLTKLERLKDQEFQTKDEFLAAIEEHVGSELSTTDKTAFWDYATKKYFVGLENWKRLLFKDEEIWPSVRKIFHFGLITMPVGLGFALFLAILLNSKHLFAMNIFRTLFYMPIMIPLVATVLIWRGVLDENTGWIDMFLERVLGLNALGSDGIRWLHDPNLIYFTYAMIGLWAIGNAMLIFLAGLQQVPTELYEAAYVDGAGWWSRLWRITLPMISPVFFYNLVIGLIVLLQYFLVPYVLVNPNAGAAAYPGYPQGATRFIMVYFYLQSFSFFKMGYGAAIAWVMFMIALILTILLFSTAKYWVYYAGEKQ